MCKPGDKEYWQVGDKVYSFHNMQIGTIKTMGLFKGYPIRMVTDNNDYGCFDFDLQGRKHYSQKPTLFHLNAITFDTQGRPVSIDYDYVPDRTPKVKITKLPHEFVLNELVLVPRDGIWRRRRFSHYTDKVFQNYVMKNQYGYKFCIPFIGNEHMEAKTVLCESGKIPDGYVFPRPKHELKPLDLVLVRGGKQFVWFVELFIRYEKGLSHPFRCLSNNYKHCIPYEGNEHLLGTTDSPEE